MTLIDVCIVAGRRATLLERTLDSFCAILLEKFTVENVFANIDPIFGDVGDELETKQVIQRFFPKAKITTPAEASFCAAVKNNWISTKSEVIFHLEDDWIINEQIEPDDIFQLFKAPEIGQVSLNNFHKHWNYRDGPYHRQWLRKKFLGMKFKTGEPFPCFTTSPSFLRGDFARHAAGLMDVRYDPEKQFYNAKNMALMNYVKPYKNFLYGENKPFIITDIGREWRDERKMTKTFVDGASVWDGTKS